MEPPDLQLVVGHKQLRPYFAALEAGTFMRWVTIWFDEPTQTGAGEFVFGEEGEALVDHGVAIVKLDDGRISHWREYVRKGPPDLDEFLTTEGKTSRWLGTDE